MEIPSESTLLGGYQAEPLTKAINLNTLLYDEGSKVFILPGVMLPITKAYPKKARFVLKLEYDKILFIYNKLLFDPFSLCFRHTKPYPFMEELTFEQMVSIVVDKGDPRGRLTEIQRFSCYIYHEIVIPNMDGEDKGKKLKGKRPYRWSVIKHSENSYIEEEDIIDIVVHEFPDKDAIFVTKCIQELVRIGAVLVQYIGADGKSIQGDDVEYPYQGKLRHSVWPRALIMTVPAYVSTVIVARSLSGISGRCAKKGTTNVDLKPQSELGLDEYQYSVLLWAAKNPITLVTGPAGSGKTKTLTGFVKCMDSNKVLVATLMSRTGSMLTRTGLNADTMHHYISSHAAWAAKNDGSDHPLFHKEVVIIDEATLPCLPVFAKFLYIVFMYTKVRHIIMAGHDWQLPSVEYGAVFIDVLKGLPECTFRLTKYYRSKSLSIFKNANEIYNFNSGLAGKRVRDKAAQHVVNVCARKYKTSGNWRNSWQDDNQDDGDNSDDDSSAYSLISKGPSLPTADLLDLEEGDQFVFEDPGASWNQEGGKAEVVIRSLLEEVISLYHYSLDNCDDDAVQAYSGSEPSKVSLFKTCLNYMLCNTHVLVLRNQDADAINKGIHSTIFGSGYMNGISEPPELIWKAMEKCSISRVKYNQQVHGNDATERLMKGAQNCKVDADRQIRVKSGSNALHKGEKFYVTKNNREKQVRNGEILRINGFKDIPLEELVQYMTPLAAMDVDTEEGDFSYVSDEDSHTYTDARFVKDGKFKIDVHDDPNKGPTHCFDGITRKVRTATVTMGEKKIKVDIYGVRAPWTNGEEVERVRIVEVTYETGEVAWCSPMDRVYMEYSDYKGNSYGNAFKVRGGDRNTGTSIKNGWVTTIHKYQGSEQKLIIYAIGNTVDRFSNCQHAYVAVSRAMEKVKVLGTKKALTLVACRPPLPRKTTLTMEVMALNISETYKKISIEFQSIREKNAKEVADLLEGLDFDELAYDPLQPSTIGEFNIGSGSNTLNKDDQTMLIDTAATAPVRRETSFDSMDSIEDCLVLSRCRSSNCTSIISTPSWHGMNWEDSRDGITQDSRVIKFFPSPSNSLCGSSNELVCKSRKRVKERYKPSSGMAAALVAELNEETKRHKTQQVSAVTTMINPGMIAVNYAAYMEEIFKIL